MHTDIFCFGLKYLQGSSGNLPAHYVENYDELQDSCRKSYISKALLAMQRAHSLTSAGNPTVQQRQLLQVLSNLFLLCNF